MRPWEGVVLVGGGAVSVGGCASGVVQGGPAQYFSITLRSSV